MKVSKDIMLADLLNTHPWLEKELYAINRKFLMLNTPIGKIVAQKVTLSDISRKVEIDEGFFLSHLEALISSFEKTAELI